MSSLDFDLSDRVSRLNKEREERKRRMKKKLDIQRARRIEAEKQAQQVKEKATAKEEARIRREREEEEARQREYEKTGGILYTDRLRAYPLARADTNRVVLPPSTLEKIMAQKNMDKPGVLTFELSVYDQATGELLEQTVSGVEEFTAEEGTVGLPPKTALCLTKDRGLQYLKEHPFVEVKYVEILSSRKSFMRVQPKGKGFHKKGEENVNIDIQKVLERTLRDHFVISKGDWIPVVHNGEKYYLVVWDLEPEPVVIVINTDLEVDIMPSEAAQRQIEIREEHERRVRTYIERMQQMKEERLRYSSEETQPKPGKGVTTIRVRLPTPKPKVITRRFNCEDQMSEVMDWVLVNMANVEPPSGFPDLTKRVYPFELVQSWPGHKRVFGDRESEMGLKGLGLIRSGESLTARWTKEELADEMVIEDLNEPETANEDEWNAAARKLQTMLENESNVSAEAVKTEDVQKATNNEIVAVFKELLELGVEQSKAQTAARLYTPQINELKSMGFGHKLVKAVPYLMKYNGRLFRVTNAILDEEEKEPQAS